MARKTLFRCENSRDAVFYYDHFILALLALIAVLYLTPNSAFHCKDVGHGICLFLEAMWFGALGGVTISLRGVYQHGPGLTPWKDGLDLWHVGRPFSGAVAGLMTVIILNVLNSKNAGSALLTGPLKGLSEPSSFLVYFVAFVFGTQEKRFFNLLYELAKVIVTVPNDDSEAGLRIDAISPATAIIGEIVVLSGQGIVTGATATLGGFIIGKPQVGADGRTIAGLVPAELTTSDPVDALVANPDGSAYVLKGKFQLRTDGGPKPLAPAQPRAPVEPPDGASKGGTDARGDGKPGEAKAVEVSADAAPSAVASEGFPTAKVETGDADVAPVETAENEAVAAASAKAEAPDPVPAPAGGEIVATAGGQAVDAGAAQQVAADDAASAGDANAGKAGKPGPAKKKG